MNTKKLFSLIFIMSLFTSLPSRAWDNVCDYSVTTLDQMLMQIVTPAPKECLVSKFLQSQCKCLYDSRKYNIFSQNVIDIGETDVKNGAKEKKKPYEAQFDRLYSKVTIQVAAQEEVMGLPKNDKKPIGCTPQDISDFVEDFSLETIPEQIEKLKLLKEKTAAKLGDKSFWRIKANILGREHFEKKVAVIENKINDLEAVSCDFAKKLFSQEDSRKKVNEVLVNKKRNPASLTPDDVLLAKLWDQYITGKLTTDVIIKKGLNGKCSSVVKSYKLLLKEHDKLVKASTAGAETIEKPIHSECAVNDTVCEKFKKQNLDLLNKTKLQFTPNSDDCITYGEYATYKGMPSQNLLEKFAKMKNPEKVFEEKNLTDNDSESLKFLQANPMIAVVAKGGNKSELGKILKTMAKNVLANRAGGESAAFKGYLDFMKGDFTELYARADSAQMNICSELARNYTAIELSSEVPKDDSSGKDGLDDMAKTRELAKSCLSGVYKDTETTDLAETLKLSPIFSLGNLTENGEPSMDGFSNFKKKHCGEKYANHKSSKCADGDMEKCRESFQETSEFAAYSQEFKKRGLNEAPSPEGWERIADRTDNAKQDHAFKDEWMEKVWPNISKQAIMGNDDHGEFAAGIANNAKVFSSPNAPTRYDQDSRSDVNRQIASTEASTQEVTDQPSSLSEAQSKPGQQVPDYAKEVPTFDPSKLAGAKGPKDLIPNFDKLPLEDQKQSLTDVKKFVASQEDSPFEAKDVDKDLDKVNSEIIKEIAELKGNIAKVKAGDKNAVAQSNGQKSSGGSYSTNTNSTYSSGGNQQSGNSSVSSGGSVNASGKIDGGNKTANAINTHLIKTFEERSGVAGDAEGRSIASKGDVTINFQKGVVDPSLLQPGLLVSEVVPESHEDFEKIKGSLDQLIQYFAKKEELKQMKGPMVYKIKDPLESPDSYILYLVSKAPNGAIDVKTIGRKSTLKGLNYSFK